ncbi:hypothetical protein K458DRAFT_479244 [Lentithecium fluviatile CBS 122367]|uniref:Uncharacterized protein n=1 Tax=Lentithecium fluviatile CBS 122367 TaxID=1168545 RepID=A0A6G1IUN1_9PLEO|nr:hypothetical protein K458DRAFT_479244 [Lentithecium fluviatile CBS 122367]
MFNCHAQTDLEVQEAISSISSEPDLIDAVCKIRKQFRIKENSLYYPLYYTREANRENAQFDDLWNCILHSAKRTWFRDKGAHTKLLHILRTIKRNPYPPNRYNGYGPGCIFSCLWGFDRTLSLFLRDNPGYGSGYTQPESHAWTNLNYFAACITKDDPENPWGNWVYCIEAMRAVLEDDMNDDEPHQRSRPGTAIQRYNSLVPAAAVWVLVLGKTLYEKKQDLTPVIGAKRPNYAFGGKLYHGPSGFNKERWTLWKKRFGEISQMGGLNDETRDLAREAFNEMEQNERPAVGSRYLLRPRKTKPSDSDQ